MAMLVFSGFFIQRLDAEESPLSQRVGLPLQLEDVYLPGPQVEPIPRKSRDLPVIVRLVETRPAQDGFRYHFEVQGLEAGHYNLADYLRIISAESGDLPHSIPFRITTALPPGLPQPTTLEPSPIPKIGGYRALLWLLGLVWLAGLAWLFFSGKGKAAKSREEIEKPTLADHLQPLLLKASQGKLDSDGQARMERLILAHWREKLPEPQPLSPAQSLALLRQHPEASPLLLKLEHWLHAPESELSPQELKTLLKPYRR